MKLGKLSELALERSVLKKIQHKRSEVISGAKVGNDGAVMQMDGSLVTAMACSGSQTFVPERYKGEEGYLEAMMLRARHTVCQAVNSLLAEGGEPFAMMVGLVIPEKLKETALKKIMDELEAMAAVCNMQIAGGHTQVSEHVTYPVITITVYGKQAYSMPLIEKKDLYGQKIVMVGNMALEATAIMAVHEKEKLEERFLSSYVEQALQQADSLHMIEAARIAWEQRATAMHDLSQTGVFGGLWELGEKMQTGLEIQLRKIPILQETIELSEYLDVNPFKVPSQGAMLIVAKDGNRLVEEYSRKGYVAAVLGTLTEGKDKVVFNQEEKRYLEQPR